MKFLRTGLVVCLAATLTACSTSDGSNDSDADGSKTIAVSLYTEGIPYYQLMKEGMETAADERGLTVTFSSANSEPQAQFDQIENAILRQPDGLVVVPIDSEAMLPAITAANQADIPVLTTGNNLSEDGQSLQRTFVGHDHTETGRVKAEYIVEALGGEGKVGMIHAIRGLEFTDAQAEAAREVFESHPGIELVDELYAGSFSTDDGLASAQNMLSRVPDIDAIFFDNDDIALGGVQAVREAGLDPSDVLIVGTDGSDAAIEQVKNGTMAATLLLCSRAEGYRAINVMADLLEGKDPESDFITTPSHLVTTDTITEILEGMGPNDC
ncbi:MAG TPA: sugar ABC transporter substrate-binding protein [Kribbella sp.]|jgi:ABC-type sugar transport system substrate-binding protein